MSDEKDRLGKVFNYVSIIFMVIIGIATFWQLHLTERQTDLILKQTDLTARQTKLIFKPVVGITTGIKATRLHRPGTEDTYENITGAIVRFTTENVGNLPAKNFKTNGTGQHGQTTLAVTRRFDESHKGMILIQGATVSNTATITKKIIDTLVEKKKRLFYTFTFSYSDWDECEQYEYSVIYEVSVVRKEPLEFAVTLVPYIP